MMAFIKLTDQGRHTHRYAEASKQRLDIAILYFLDAFRASYLTENKLQKSDVSIDFAKRFCIFDDKMFQKMQEKLGSNGNEMDGVLEYIICKIVQNLQFYASAPNLILNSLRLFKVLSKHVFILSMSVGIHK